MNFKICDNEPLLMRWISWWLMIFFIWFEIGMMPSTRLCTVMLSWMAFGSITCPIFMPMFTTCMLFIARWWWRGFLLFVITADHLWRFNFQWICIFIVATIFIFFKCWSQTNNKKKQFMPWHATEKKRKRKKMEKRTLVMATKAWNIVDLVDRNLCLALFISVFFCYIRCNLVLNCFDVIEGTIWRALTKKIAEENIHID